MSAFQALRKNAKIKNLKQQATDLEKHMFRRWQAHHRKEIEAKGITHEEQWKNFRSDLAAEQALVSGKPRKLPAAPVTQESVTVSTLEGGEDQPE